MPPKEKFGWGLLRARNKYLKEESYKVVSDLRRLLADQERSLDYETRIQRTEAIFRYLQTPAATRVVEDNFRLRDAIRNKLIEFNELGLANAAQWAVALQIELD